MPLPSCWVEVAEGKGDRFYSRIHKPPEVNLVRVHSMKLIDAIAEPDFQVGAIDLADADRVRRWLARRHGGDGSQVLSVEPGFFTTDVFVASNSARIEIENSAEEIARQIQTKPIRLLYLRMAVAPPVKQYANLTDRNRVDVVAQRTFRVTCIPVQIRDIYEKIASLENSEMELGSERNEVPLHASDTLESLYTSFCEAIREHELVTTKGLRVRLFVRHHYLDPLFFTHGITSTFAKHDAISEDPFFHAGDLVVLVNSDFYKATRLFRTLYIGRQSP